MKTRCPDGANDTHMPHPFGVVEVFREQPLVGVFRGGDQVQQPVDVIHRGHPVRDRNTPSQRGFDIGQHIAGLRLVGGIQAAVVVVTDQFRGGVPLGAQVVDARQQYPEPVP